MLTILATIFVFGIIVFIHEFGHFITAKASGMRVDEFAIGFGPAIAKKRKGETLYSIRAIPLGGYNKIAGMDPEEPLDDRSFLNKPVWKRFIVIAAGALFIGYRYFLYDLCRKRYSDSIYGTGCREYDEQFTGYDCSYDGE